MTVRYIFVLRWCSCWLISSVLPAITSIPLLRLVCHELWFRADTRHSGNVAGLGRFDELLGCSIFNSIYGRNANVFAAVPRSMPPIWWWLWLTRLWTAAKKWLIALFAVIMVGIWWTAVYSGHHYLIDVMLGISCALLGILVFEQG